ncbi:MAG: hypothetical protein A3G76_06715 [Acidobacteria bacterium RIFCSPLOWO2_12_FULL_65_11]|nr:MAG: hypothetical protein A3H95_12140 [Acidobacteria bacterium RIFCSPLOWO2_02_FULL_64_15]OFW34291.1 MAG: hypothetical protein A3G76_06715 [Acidobacteria bacterium RIFCSPLOWO2_12_FULL_65_11]
MVKDQPSALWTLRKEGREVSCLVRLVPHAIEVDLVFDGDTLVTRAFATDTEALAWADEERVEREGEGWKRSDAPLRVSKAD